MNSDATIFHISREYAEPIFRGELKTMQTTGEALSELFASEARGAIARVLGVAIAVMDGQWPSDPLRQLEFFSDAQGLCRATEQYLEELKVRAERCLGGR